MITYRVNKFGNCPYDNNVDFEEISKLRPDRTLVLCVMCGKYSIKHNNGFVYPLIDPLDSSSTPAVLVKIMD